MNILVTGGAGYIGSMLVEKLLNNGHTVFVVDLCIYDTDLDLTQKNLIFYKEDVRFINWETILTQNIDAVFHLAGISNDPGYGITDEIGCSINYDATVRLYDECRKYRIPKFIFPSSCSIYGRQSSNTVLLSEESAVNPLTNYARLKVKVEDYILKNPGINYTIVRPATVYGYSYRQRFDLVVNSYIAKIYNNETIHVSNKENIRPSLYINDLVDIYSRLLDCSKASCQIYNIATSNYSLNDTFTRIKQILHSESVLISNNNVESRSYQVSSEKLLSLFPDFTFTPLEEGIKPLIKKFNKEMFCDYDTNSNYYGKLRQPIFFRGDTL